MAIVELRDIGKRFGPHQVLRDVDLSIRDGEFLVLVGPSGCGKSTLLRIVAGLDEADEGDVLIGGESVNDRPPAKRGIAMVFQSYALYPNMTVYGNMAFGLRRQTKSAEEVDSAVRAAAKLLDIEHLLDRRPKALSGGQRQRVAIGRAIVRKPSVFLFDEPLSNLDASLRVRMRYEFAKLHQRLSTTTIYVTHDQVEAMTLADRIAILDQGVVQQLGTPEDLYERPATKFVAGFIGSPKMNFIDGALVKDGESIAVEASDGVRLPVSPQLGARHLGEAVTLGIRPEHLVLQENGIRATVGLVEWLGSLRFAYLSSRITDEPLIMQLAPDANLSEGQEVVVGARPADCHLFDSRGAALSRSGYDPGAIAA